MIHIKTSYQIILTFILFAILYDFSQPVLAALTYTADKKFISYTDMGKGEPLILIHAFPTDKRLWNPQQKVLKSYFRIITLDLWGFGQSSPVNSKAVTMIQYADEVKQLLDQLHIQKAIIGGESMGGYVALAFLEKYPNNVSGLVLSDTQSISDNKKTKIKRESAAQDVLAHGTNHIINGFILKALTLQASHQTQQFLRDILASQSSTAVSSALRGMALRTDTSKLLSITQVPILIITGVQDTLILPQQSQNMHKLVGNSKLVVITKAAHLSSLEQPDQWNRAVINMFHK